MSISTKSRKIIYSCLVGNYDKIPNIKVTNKDWTYVLFTDIETERSTFNGWEIKPLQHIVKDDPVRTNRWHKINSHLIFEECDCSIYIDSNIEIKDGYLFKRADRLLKKNVFFALVIHPTRNCVYKEAEICIRIGKDTKSNIQKNIDFLTAEEYPKNNGLFENGILFRNHNHPEQLEKVNSLWWELLKKMSRRDQLSLVYVFWKLKIQPHFLFEDRTSTFRSHASFNFISKHQTNNKIFEITENELYEVRHNLEKEFQKSFTYKYFYRLERYIKNRILKKKN